MEKNEIEIFYLSNNFRVLLFHSLLLYKIVKELIPVYVLVRNLDKSKRIDDEGAEANGSMTYKRKLVTITEAKKRNSSLNIFSCLETCLQIMYTKQI